LGGGRKVLGVVNGLRLGWNWLMVVAVSNAWLRVDGLGRQESARGRMRRSWTGGDGAVIIADLIFLIGW